MDSLTARVTQLEEENAAWQKDDTEQGLHQPQTLGAVHHSIASGDTPRDGAQGRDHLEDWFAAEDPQELGKASLDGAPSAPGPSMSGQPGTTAPPPMQALRVQPTIGLPQPSAVPQTLTPSVDSGGAHLGLPRREHDLGLAYGSGGGLPTLGMLGGLQTSLLPGQEHERAESSQVALLGTPCWGVQNHLGLVTTDASTGRNGTVAIGSGGNPHVSTSPAPALQDSDVFRFLASGQPAQSTVGRPQGGPIGG